MPRILPHGTHGRQSSTSTVCHSPSRHRRTWYAPQSFFCCAGNSTLSSSGRSARRARAEIIQQSPSACCRMSSGVGYASMIVYPPPGTTAAPPPMPPWKREPSSPGSWRAGPRKTSSGKTMCEGRSQVSRMLLERTPAPLVDQPLPFRKSDRGAGGKASSTNGSLFCSQ